MIIICFFGIISGLIRTLKIENEKRQNGKIKSVKMVKWDVYMKVYQACKIYNDRIIIKIDCETLEEAEEKLNEMRDDFYYGTSDSYKTWMKYDEYIEITKEDN